MKFINPYLKIHDGLTLRWSELQHDKNLLLEDLWNRGQNIECLCNGLDNPIEMGIGKRGEEFYVFNKNPAAHTDQCACKHIGKRGEYFNSHSLGNLHQLLEKTLDGMGMTIWSPNFERVRNKYLFRKKFVDQFSEGLLFYPEYGENFLEQNLLVINSMPGLCGGEFYAAGFIHEYHVEPGFKSKGSFFKLSGFDKKFFMDSELGNALRKRDNHFEFFALFKVLVLTSGKYVAVDASGIYLHKKTLTPHYKKDRDINSGRVFKSNLRFMKKTKEKSNV